MADYYGAVDIGGTKINVGLVDDTAQVTCFETFATPHEQQAGEHAVAQIVSVLHRLCAKQNLTLDALGGIGVVCTGPVDPKTGMVNNPYTLEGWGAFPLSKQLAQATNLPVRIENDANGALLGEMVCQQIPPDKRVLMVTIGTGIGVAVWHGDGLYRCGDLHPEMGHVMVSGNGERCYCGRRGCFESRCSGQALNQRAGARGFSDFDYLYQQAEKGHPIATAELDDVRTELVAGLWSLSVVFKPDVLIVGGGMGERYFDLIQQAMMQQGMTDHEDFIGTPVLQQASEQGRSALVGAYQISKRGEE